jgi:putative ABC transport system substrate-binding protein
VKRRELITLLGAAAAWPLAARAQRPAVPVIGILGGQLPETYEPFLVPFRQGLSEVGFVEGNNVAIESRWAQGRYDRLPDLADVLVSRRVALIYAVGGTEVALAAKGATQIIPIVITIGGDPVKAGLVASLNRPGGNLTGTSFYTVGLGTKRLELLYELVPRVSVIAVLVQTGSAIAEEQLSDLQQAANALRLRLVVLGVTSDADLELAFAKVALEGAGALCVTAGAFFTSRRDKLGALAAQHRIPTMYPCKSTWRAGD